MLSVDGVSYGMFVAERYAISHPDRVSRLVLDSVVLHEGVDPLELAAIVAAEYHWKLPVLSGAISLLSPVLVMGPRTV